MIDQFVKCINCKHSYSAHKYYGKCIGIYNQPLCECELTPDKVLQMQLEIKG